MWPKQYLVNALAGALVFLTAAAGLYFVFKLVNFNRVFSNYQQISVEGTGKAKGAPQVATLSLGVLTSGKNASVLYKQNTDKMNAMTEAFKKLGIPLEDLQTENYSIYPIYSYPVGEAAQIEGFEISQMLTVKVRDMTKLDTVLAKAVSLGSNQLFGPTFTVDDDKTLRDEARQLAMKDLQEKKAIMEKTLNLKLGRVVSYYEYVEQPVGGPTPLYEKGGMGGGDVSPPLPSIQTGTLELTMKVNVSYELR